ncbi:hypothetical protein HLB01_05485 [Bordetella trematum]|nr:hypothetical protein [Bordetella trematum]NNH18491.1 hypothetical protein [Bordetella trematum]
MLSDKGDVMRTECVNAVSQVLGRPITQAEAQGIEGRINQAMHRLASEDRQAWLGMSQSERLMAAADRAARDVAADAALKRRRVALTALRHDAISNYIANSPHTPIEALRRMLAFYSDGKSGTISIESTANAIRNEALGEVLEVFDALQGRMMGLFADREGILALVRELKGQASGNADAALAAKRFQSMANRLRERFNRSGGNIGRLEDWGMPQSHSQRLAALAGRERWVQDHLAWVDRNRYSNVDGSLMTDAELAEFLGHAWESIATNGANKLEPGQPSGFGMRANRGSQERQIHYRDAETYIEAQQRYSDTPLFQTIIGYVDRMARDIALVETMGPNPNAMMRYWADSARKEMVAASPADSGKIEAELAKLETLYSEVSGAKSSAGSQALAEGFDTYRALNVASKLGSAVITSITDIGTQALTAIYNGMPVTRVFMNELRTLNPAKAADRRQALRAGLGIQQFLGSVNRWGVDGLSQDSRVTGRFARHAQGFAAGVMKLSGMNAVTRAGQQAFGTVMMDSLGSLTRSADDLATLAARGAANGDARLARTLQSYGISDAEFSVWKLAQPEDWRGLGDTVLTAESIYRLTDAQLAPLAAKQGISTTTLRERAATRLMGVVEGEVNMAVVEPGARERSAMYGSFSQRRGSLPTELYRSALQFKSFPISMMMRHGQRAFGQASVAGKAGYVAALVGLTTVFGALALQANEVASGRDPRDMRDPRFWGQSFMKGGALGIYGDFLFADYTQFGSSLAGVVGGPILGDMETLMRATMGNIQRTGEGRDASGAAAVQLLKGKTPFANLWYTKAATDRLIFNQLQELASPGYLRRMERRARREFGQQYYWKPGELAPQRGPDFERAFGS